MLLKILPLTLWLLLHLTLSGYAQTPPQLPSGHGNAYGIDRGQLYPGTLVLELMEAAEAEIEAAVREAYAEGYKAAAVRFVPELAVQQAQVAQLKMNIERLITDRRKLRRNMFTACGLSLLGGMASGIIAGVVIAGR